MEWILLGLLLTALVQAVWEALIYLYEHKNDQSDGGCYFSCWRSLAGPAAFVAQGSINLPSNVSVELSQLINRDDFSYVSRSDFMRWGFNIVKDHPVIGTGAGGWNALLPPVSGYPVLDVGGS